MHFIFDMLLRLSWSMLKPRTVQLKHVMFIFCYESLLWPINVRQLIHPVILSEVSENISAKNVLFA